MKKRRIIISVIVIILLILVIVGVLIYHAKPVTLLENRINRQIAANMLENELDWEIVLYGLYYEFPGEIKGKAYLCNSRYDILIDVDRLILKPRFGTLLKRTQLYEMRGNALGGSFNGNFALGKKDDFTLHFERLSSQNIKELSTGQLVNNYTAIVVSGTLNIMTGVVQANTNIDSIKITLPEPLSMAGDLYFYDGKLDFEAANNTITLKQALIKNSDAEISVTGVITALNADESLMDLYGVLVVSNPSLAYILSLSEEGDKNTPEFRFRITGSTNSPSLRFVPPESKTAGAAAAEIEPAEEQPGEGDLH